MLNVFRQYDTLHGAAVALLLSVVGTNVRGTLYFKILVCGVASV